MMVIPMAFLLIARKVIAGIVREKESGMKEYLQINGCSPVSYHFSTIITEALFGIIVRFFGKLINGLDNPCNPVCCDMAWQL